MAADGIKDAFSTFGAERRNERGSIVAWAPDRSLVVCLWAHDAKRSEPGTLEFAGTANLGMGPGYAEFCSKVDLAYKAKSPIRLVIGTVDRFGVRRLERGESPGTIKQKDYHARSDLIGSIIEWNRKDYAFRFVKA